MSQCALSASPPTWCTDLVRTVRMYVLLFPCSLFTRPQLSCITSLFSVHYYLPLPHLSVLFSQACLSTCVILRFNSILSLSLLTIYLFISLYILYLKLLFLPFLFEGDVIYENRIKELFEGEEARFVTQTKKSFEAAVTRYCALSLSLPCCDFQTLFFPSVLPPSFFAFLYPSASPIDL